MIIVALLAMLIIPAQAEPAQYTVFVPMIRQSPRAKRGIGCITQADYTCEDVRTSGASWMHDWSMSPKQCGVPTACQAWGLGSEMQDPDPACIAVLLWNEPGVAAQANIAPQVAATRWIIVEQRRTDWDKPISTPCDEVNWLDVWADHFWNANQRWPLFDYVCIHNYPSAFTADSAVQQTIAEVDAAHEWSLAHGGDGRVVLQEFAVWPAWGTTAEYMEQILPQLDRRPYLWYSWFALSDVGEYITGNTYQAHLYDTSLVADGALTALGETYAQSGAR